MGKRAILIVLIALAGCAGYEIRFNQVTPTDGASSALVDLRPEWLRDPARGEYPYSPKGW